MKWLGALPLSVIQIENLANYHGKTSRSLKCLSCPSHSRRLAKNAGQLNCSRDSKRFWLASTSSVISFFWRALEKVHLG